MSVPSGGAGTTLFCSTAPGELTAERLKQHGQNSGSYVQTMRVMYVGRKGVGTHPPAADPATYPTKNLFTLTQNQSSLSCIWRRCVFICGTCAANLHPARYSGAGNALFFTPAPPNATQETHIYERTRPTSVGRVLEERRLPTLPPGGAVPSALVSLTSLFGMGRGGSSPL